MGIGDVAIVDDDHDLEDDESELKDKKEVYFTFY